MFDESNFWAFYLDDVGEVRGSGEYGDGYPCDKKRLLQPPGFQTFPRDSSEANGKDGLAWREGDTTEIIALSDRDTMAKLPKIQRGQSRVYSLDENPQIISVKSDEIKIGKNATRGIARKDDEVGGVNVTVIGTQITGSTFTITITMVDTKQTMTVLGPITVVGLLPQPAVAVNFSGVSKIQTASTLGKAE